MSCLDTPRLHFKGNFHANPSTINNTLSNYNFEQGAYPNPLVMSWNSYGDASFSIDAKITTLIGPDGKPFSDPALTGATIGSGQANPPAKLVDLDVDQQTRTRYYGLNVQVGDSLLQGHFVDTAFILNLWFRKAASGSGADNQAGGLFQTILDPVQWGDVSGSPFLQLLRDTAQQKGRQISMRFAVFGYEPTPTDPSYSQGTIVGSLGLPVSQHSPQGQVSDGCGMR